MNVVINLVRIAICAADTAEMSAPPLRTESAVPEEVIYSARESARTGEQQSVFSVTLGNIKMEYVEIYSNTYFTHCSTKVYYS